MQTSLVCQITVNIQYNFRRSSILCPIWSDSNTFFCIMYASYSDFLTLNICTVVQKLRVVGKSLEYFLKTKVLRVEFYIVWKASRPSIRGFELRALCEVVRGFWRRFVEIEAPVTNDLNSLTSCSVVHGRHLKFNSKCGDALSSERKLGGQ